MLENIPQELRGKCEFLSNAICHSHCPVRKMHYLDTSKTNLTYGKHKYSITTKCQIKGGINDPDTLGKQNNLTWEDIQKYNSMGYKYFKDKRYLASSKRTADYLEKELISKADYFSSTLDANCEDKEASLYAATATYYLSLITKGEEHRHYADLTKKAAYFALSWYYLWDVPFAPGQMLGDIGLKTRGWGNVSVENNHIDVFVFEFASVLQWLSKEYAEPRMADFAEVISTSMRQLLPYEGHLCGIAKSGFYPEVVQHTNWDYGKNGKGYYNDIFAPGWTVASLWELLTPGRAERFLLD